MRASPIKNAFNAGELSPLLDGRVDLAKYAAGCEKMRNIFPLIQGPAVRRAGFRYVSEVKDSSKRTWLARFEFNFQQSFVLEFSPLKLRFFTNHGIVQSSPGVPYEITTPFTEAMLTTAEGLFGLSMAPSNDVIYIACSALPPQKLQRITNTNWTIGNADIINGPFKDINDDESITVYSSGETGSITLTASSSLFSGVSGQLFYLEQKVVDSTKAWEGSKSVTTGDYRRNSGNNYKALNTATTGFVGPVHTMGAKFDGDNGVQWEYHDSGFAIVKFTGNGTTSATATVQGKYKVPINAVGSGNASYRWAKAAWNSTDGYPTSVTYFLGRLVFARNQRIWFSISGDPENFATREFGQVIDDSAFDVTIENDDAAQITYLVPTNRGLIVGTTSGELIIEKQSLSEAFSATNRQVSPSSGYGARAIQPIRVDDIVVFVQRAGRKVRETQYDFQTDSFKSPNISVLASHITSEGIQQMVMQREPSSVIWMVGGEGSLIGLTYNKEQDVAAWHKHAVADGLIEVESVTCIPNPNGIRDDLWIVGKVTVNGSVKRYVMYMEKEYESSDNQADCFYVDAGLTYDGSPVTTVSGLSHLEGMEVQVLADGAAHPERTVSSGAITLQRASSVVQVGLKYTPELRTMRIEAGSADGTSQGKTKRINSIIIRFLNSLGVLVKAQTEDYEEISFRTPSDLMDEAVPLFTGDKEIWVGDYDEDGYIDISQNQPFPMTIIALMPQVVTYDKG